MDNFFFVPPNKKKILVAEDVHTNQQIIVEMIGLLGHDVEIASNGQAAVEKYLSGKYSLIFMDCQMPVMDGYTATQKLRRIEMDQNIERVPIVALTAGSDKEDKERCRRAGMDGYLTKPFSISDIQKHLNKYLQPTSFKHERRENTGTNIDEPDVNGVAESKVLDQSAIENIREIERQTGKQLLPSIFEGYVKQMEEKLRDIEHEVRSDNSVSIYRTAHAIKSMSANIGAEKVRSLSAAIESKGRDNDIADLSESVVGLTQAYQEFLVEFSTTYTR